MTALVASRLRILMLLQISLAGFLCHELPASGARKMEFLDRGLIALKTEAGPTFLSWRLLGNDESDVGFNVYRRDNGGAVVRLNRDPLIVGTCFWIQLRRQALAISTRYVRSCEAWKGLTRAFASWMQEAHLASIFRFR